MHPDALDAAIPECDDARVEKDRAPPLPPPPLDRTEAAPRAGPPLLVFVAPLLLLLPPPLLPLPPLLEFSDRMIMSFWTTMSTGLQNT